MIGVFLLRGGAQRRDWRAALDMGVLMATRLVAYRGATRCVVER